MESIPDKSLLVMKKIKRFKKNFEKSLEEGGLKYIVVQTPCIDEQFHVFQAFLMLAFIFDSTEESETCLPSRSSNNTSDI